MLLSKSVRNHLTCLSFLFVDSLLQFRPAISSRNELYELSGIRAQYPQFFFVYNEDSRTTYLGDWKTLQKIHHAEGLPRGYRDANPTVSTWNQIFCDTSQIFSV